MRPEMAVIFGQKNILLPRITFDQLVIHPENDNTLFLATWLRLRLNRENMEIRVFGLFFSGTLMKDKERILQNRIVDRFRSMAI